MIYKHMYIAYVKNNDIETSENEKILTSTVKYYNNLAVLYFETDHTDIVPEDFAKGSTVALPDGRHWTEATEIFHYFEPKNDEQWKRRYKKKTCEMRVNHLKRDKIASYIYYHVEHQNDSQVGVDKFMSIFLFEDMIFMYSEKPTEKIKWEDIQGRNHHGNRYKWMTLMNKHFKEWPDGTKGWKEL